MSQIKVRKALEAAVAAMSPALATAWENAAFQPPDAATPYQEVAILFAQPENLEFGRNYVERGFMQITLNYPQQKGPNAAQARGELLRETFYRSASFVASGVTVIIERTPEIMAGSTQNGRWAVPVRIRFFAHVIS